MPKPPDLIKPNDPIRAPWLNDVATAAFGIANVQGRGYADANGAAFSAGRTPPPAVKGFAKHTTDIPKGLQSPVITVDEYRSPAWGDVATGNTVDIDWAVSDIPTGTLMYYEEIDEKIHATPFECIPIV
jgi:hypothetical protein